MHMTDKREKMMRRKRDKRKQRKKKKRKKLLIRKLPKKLKNKPKSDELWIRTLCPRIHYNL